MVGRISQQMLIRHVDSDPGEPFSRARDKSVNNKRGSVYLCTLSRRADFRAERVTRIREMAAR